MEKCQGLKVVPTLLRGPALRNGSLRYRYCLAISAVVTVPSTVPSLLAYSC